MKGVILHGGRANGLSSLAYSEVQQLLPVAGKPISEYALRDLVSAGLTDIDIVVGNAGADEVIGYFGDGRKWGAHVSYTKQEKPEGIAQAVGLVKEFVGSEPFVVYLGDNMLQHGIAELVPKFEESDYDALLLVSKVPNPEKFGVADIVKGRIVRVLEKPKEPPSDFALVGVYFLRKKVFEAIERLHPASGGEYELTDAIQLMIDSGLKIAFEQVRGWWKDTGTMEDLIDANRLVLDEVEGEMRSLDTRGQVSGRAVVMEDVRIDRSSVVMGPCFIGRSTRLVNTFIGPYTSIGGNCLIEGVEIDDSIVMDGCRIEGNGFTKISESLIGTGSDVVKGNGVRKSTKLLVGRNSKVEL